MWERQNRQRRLSWQGGLNYWLEDESDKQDKTEKWDRAEYVDENKADNEDIHDNDDKTWKVTKVEMTKATNPT